MNNRLDKLINEKTEDFNSITESIKAYIAMKQSHILTNIDTEHKITLDCVNGFKRLIQYSFKYGNFKDTWNCESYYKHIDGPELIVKSLKTNYDFRIGLEKNEIYLSCGLRFKNNLRFMGDNFWQELLELSKFKGFKYLEFESISNKQRKEYPELFRTNKSMIFRIMRKYIFDFTNREYPSNSTSLGEFQVTWNKEYDLKEVIKECCLAFKIMYSLNYKLWKIDN